MRLLIVSQHFHPESFRINDVAAELVRQGVEVTVLTGKPNYPEGRVYPGHRAAGLDSGCWNGVTIHRVPLVPRGDGGAARLAANYLSFIAATVFLGPWALRRAHFDAVFVYGTSPIFQALGALLIGRLRRVPVVTWVQDLWPDSLRITGHLRDPRLLAAVAAAVRWTYRRHDLLLGQSHAFVRVVEPMAGGVPVRHLPNPGAAASDPVPKAGDPAGFDVVFAGNLGTVQALGTIADAAERLKGTPVRIVIYGSGSRCAWLAETIAARGLDNVVLAGRRAPEDMPAIFACASALLITLARDDTLASTVPSKLQSYLAAGRPIIAALDGEGAEIVRAAGAGLAVPAEDASGLADAIAAVYAATAAQRAAMGAAARACFEREFALESLVERLRCLLDETVRQSRGKME